MPSHEAAAVGMPPASGITGWHAAATTPHATAGGSPLPLAHGPLPHGPLPHGPLAHTAPAHTTPADSGPANGAPANGGPAYGAAANSAQLATARRAKRILIVDDEPKIGSFVGRALASAGYQTQTASSATDGLRAALQEQYDLIILDLLMPDVDGLSVLDQVLRARPDQAVMVLSCVADVPTKVSCLERGAQDYLTKPFSLAELLARVRVRLREDPHSHGAQDAQGELIRAGQLTLDVARLVADIGNGPVALSRLEFMLLRELAEHQGQCVPKEKLLATVWGYDFDPGSNVVDVCVRRLRSKLGFDLIKTVRNQGYQLAGR